MSTLAHGSDVPKQITLSDHCFGFKFMYFHRSDALPVVNPTSSPFRPYENCSVPCFSQQRIWLKSKNHYYDETKEQRDEFLKSPVLGLWKSITVAFYDMHRCSGSILSSRSHRGKLYLPAYPSQTLGLHTLDDYST